MNEGPPPKNPGPEPDYPAARVAWYAVFVLVLAIILALLDRQILSLLVGPIRRDLRITDTDIGLLQGTAFAVFYATAGLPLGLVVDRVSRRNLLAIAILVWSVMSMACGLASSFWELFAARVGVGIGEACLLPASYSLVSDLFSAEHRGRAAGTLGMAAALGAGGSLIIGAGILRSLKSELVTVPLFGQIAVWKAMFILIGLPGLPMALLMLTIREPARRGIAGLRAVRGAGLRSFSFFLQQNFRKLLPIIGASALIVCASSAAIYWGPTAMIRRFHLSAGQVGLPFGLATLIGGFLGPLIGGVATDRWIASGRAGGRLTLFTVGTPIAMIGAALLAFWPQPTLAYVGMALVTLGGSALTTAAFTTTQDICPNQFRGQAIALTNLANNLVGISLGPLLVALVTQYVFAQEIRLSAALAVVAVPTFALGLWVAIVGMPAFKRSRPAAL